jgi:hypothetical protein
MLRRCGERLTVLTRAADGAFELRCVDSAYGVWRSNAWPTVHDHAATYKVGCRLNHSCRPNAHIAWNPRLRKMTVHALKPIARGVEVTVEYFLNGGEDRDGRRASLKRDFGFVCRCALCSLSGDELRRSDTRQVRIAELHEMLFESPSPSAMTSFAELAHERLALLEDEGMAATSWDFMAAASHHFLHEERDLARATDWAQRALACALNALGADSSVHESLATVHGLLAREQDARVQRSAV